MKPEYIVVDIDSIIFLEENPRNISDYDFQKLCEDIEKDPDFLIQRPPLLNRVDGKYYCYAGTQRVKAAKKCGYDTLYAFVENDLPKEVQTERMLKDNLHRGRWDEKKLLDLNIDLDIMKDFCFNDIEVSIFNEVIEPTVLTTDLKEAPPTMKITFQSIKQMEQFENQLKYLIENISDFNNITYSVSAGEI